MKRILKVLGISLVLAGIVAAVLAGTAYAAGPQGNTNGNTPGYCQGQAGGPMIDSISKLLGMTKEQIQEQRLAGKSLVQIAATKNITEDALINAIVTERQTALQARVTAGQFTQAQADQQVTQMKDRVKEMVERTTTGQPNGANCNGNGMLGRGGMRGNQGCNGTFNGVGGMMRAGRITN
jgi:Spy/CpxP family protein refolding chaperone